MYDLNHLSALPAMTILAKFDMRRVWSNVANAALISSRTILFNMYYQDQLGDLLLLLSLPFQ